MPSKSLPFTSTSESTVAPRSVPRQDLADTVKRLRLATKSAGELLVQADQFHRQNLDFPWPFWEFEKPEALITKLFGFFQWSMEMFGTGTSPIFKIGLEPCEIAVYGNTGEVETSRMSMINDSLWLNFKGCIKPCKSWDIYIHTYIMYIHLGLKPQLVQVLDLRTIIRYQRQEKTACCWQNG